MVTQSWSQPNINTFFVTSHKWTSRDLRSVFGLPLGQGNEAAEYSSLDGYDDWTFYQSLDKKVSEIPVYQRLKKGQAQPLHSSDIPSLQPNPHTAGLAISKEKASATDLPSSSGVYEQTLEMYTPYATRDLYTAGVQREPVYEPLGEPSAQGPYESLGGGCNLVQSLNNLPATSAAQTNNAITQDI